jgi:lantibiotic modifying enzyme
MAPVWRAETIYADDSPVRTAWRELSASVLGTGMAPHWQLSWDRRKASDISALGGFGEQESELSWPRWYFTGTDRMELRFEPGVPREMPNLPRLGGQRIDITGLTGALADGFRSMYGFICEQRDSMLAPNGPIDCFRGRTARVLYRATRLYGLLFLEMQRPKHQHDGADLGMLLEMLAQAFVKYDEKPLEWPVFAAEVAAIQRLDTPIFRYCTDQRDLILENGKTIAQAFSISGYDAAVGRLRAASQTALDGQLRILRDALACRFGTSAETALPAPRRVRRRNGPLSPDELIDSAVELGEQLRDRAIVTSEGMTWIGPQTCPAAGKVTLRLLEFRLYDVACGVAVFLGALTP